MSDDFDVRGADALANLAKALKGAGNGKELRKELLRSIRVAGKPIIAEIKSSLRENLPKSGGMADDFSKGTKVSVRSRLTGDKAGVRLIAKYGRHDLPNLNRGRLRHPVYGNRNRWESQEIAPGSISTPVEQGREKLQIAVADAIDTVFHKIERSV